MVAPEPSGGGSSVPAMFVRELEDGQEIDQVLLVRESELRTRRDGTEYLRLLLGDRSGSVPAVVREGVAGVQAVCAHGACVRVTARYGVHPRFGPELTLHGVRPAEPGEYELADLLDGPPHTVEQMEGDLRELIGQVQQPHLRSLLERVLGPGAPTWPAYRDAPAAKRYHQAYRHGLLEHSLGVAQAVAVISTTFPGIDRDVAITGALLHDIGKLDAYTADPLAIDMTDLGKLQGEIPLGYYRIRRLIEDDPGFPADLAAAVLHIILAHHGTLEYGSPVVPCTREATLVHMIDNLGGRLGSFDRIEKELPDGSAWSGYDRALGGGAFFAGRQAA
jgi:3'-5' exoribonuclease